jgi:type II secretory ATPase GspE/PulE/Tfp pilus assembly ATPase PilB-like protein
MIDLGVDPFSLGTSLRAVMAQRLVRRLCHCHDMAPPRDFEVEWLQRHQLPVPERVGAPVGCPECGNIGMKGRLPIIEMITTTRAVRLAIETGDREAISEAASSQPQYVPLLQAGVATAIDGNTSIQEVMRAASDNVDLERPV